MRTRAALLVALVVVVSFPTIATMRRTFAPNGAVAGQMAQPSRLAYPYTVQEPTTIDAGAFSWFFEPMTATAHRAWSEGTIPLWNPYAGLGMPLAANAQSAVASPLQLPVLIHPEQRTWNAVILLRLAVGALGCLVLLRLLGAPATAATGAALLYGLAPTFTRWAPQVSMNVEALAPWLLAAILLLARRPGALPFAAVAGLTAAAGYGGQPEALVCLAYLATAWAAWCWWRDGRTRRTLLNLAGAGLCGALLAAPQLLLLAEYVLHATDSHAGGLGATRLAFSDLDSIVRRDGLQGELLGWPLALIALLGAITAWRSRIGGTSFLLAAAGIWALRSLDTPIAAAFEIVPGVADSNVPRYGQFILALAAALLAAAALTRVPRPLLAVPVVIAIVVGQVWLLHPPRQFAIPVDASRPLPSLAAARVTLTPGGRLAAIGRNVRPQLASALGIADPRAEDALYPRRYARLVALRGGGARFGFLGALDPQTATLDLVDATGVRLLAASPGSSPPAGFTPAPTRPDDLALFANAEAYPRGFTPAAVVFVASEDAAAAALRGNERLRERSVVERPTAAMRAARGSATADVVATGWDRERLRVHADGDALLIVSSQWFPGWRARIDGAPAEMRPANLAMRAVVVPDGEHDLEFVYEPGSFRAGLALGALGLAVIGARALLSRRRRSTVVP